mgnify:FL=1
MSKSYHFTDIMFDLYKRQAKAKIIMDMYDTSIKTTPLVEKECVACGKKISHAHIINGETNGAICPECYKENQIVYKTLSEVLDKFKRKEV